MTVRDRRADVEIRPFSDIAIAAQPADVGQVAPLVAGEEIVAPLINLTGRLEKQHRVENQLRNGEA